MTCQLHKKNYALSGGDTVRSYGEPSHPPIIERLATFSFRDGKWDVALFSGELTPGDRKYLLRIPVPTDLLIAGEVLGEISEPEAQPKNQTEHPRGNGLWPWKTAKKAHQTQELEGRLAALEAKIQGDKHG